MERATMQAAVLHRAGDLRLEEVPRPEPGPDEALIRVGMNGLCGSDIHFFESGELGPYRVTKPYIPGHEASGVVVHAAKSGIGPKEGARVAIEPGVPCRRCEWCKSGRYNLCTEVVFMSAPPVNGTFAEFAAVAADFAHSIPDSVGDEEAAFIEPLSVALQAVKRCGFSAGLTAAVVGAGPIGLVTVLSLAAFGASAIYVLDTLDHRLELARRLGATDCYNVARQDATSLLATATAGRLVDAVFDTAGNSSACASTPLLCRRGGVVTLVGWPELRDVPFPIEEVLERELDVRGVNRYCNTFPLAVSLLAAGKIDVAPLVSHRFPFADVVEAFRFASEHRTETVKVMIGNTEAPR